MKAVMRGLTAVGVTAVIGCASGGSGEADAPTFLLQPDAAGEVWVESTLASLSLEEAVGQLIFPWLSGSYNAEDDPEFLEAAGWVEEWGIGGVVISIGSPHAYAAKLNALQLRADIPLLVTSDFENGGPGMRINHSYALPSLLAQGGGASFPPTMAFGAIGDEAEVENFARITALEARALGVHLTFSPVLDVNSNPENPIINTRSFGEDPLEVARLGRAYLRGAREGGILATAKHFPGHGDTRIDSHLALPEVSADRARLDAVELVPFRDLIEAGIDAVMTAHVSVPGVLGPGAPPATLSPEFMTTLLREEMGFEGLLFTDALRMGAITEGYGAGEAAVLALEAGADVILVPASVSGAGEALIDAVNSGRVTRDRIDASVRRILTAKAQVGLHQNRTVSLEEVTRRVGIREHREAADRVAARSITLPRDIDVHIPVDPRRAPRVLSLTYAAPEDLTAGREFDTVLRSFLPSLESVRISPAALTDDLAALLDRAAGAEMVLFNAYVPPRAGAGTVALSDPVRAFAEELNRRVPTILVSFGNPYLLSALPSVGTYLLAWGDREVSQRAAARAVVGAASINGRLPITLPGLHSRGEGLTRAAIPEVAAQGAGPRDALDEAGLVRTLEDSSEEGGEGGAGAGGDETQQVPGSEDPPAAGPALPGPGAFLPPPPQGDPAPPNWATLPVSPLEVDPATVGMDPAALDSLDAVIARAIADSVSPGVSIAIARRGQLVRLRGYGRLDWDPSSAPVTPFSIYDLASLTKVVGTTAAIMLLEEEGRINLDDPVVRYLPEFSEGDSRKVAITVEDLLRHRSGLPAFRQFFLESRDPAFIREAVLALPLETDPRARTLYSDIGFILLGWVAAEAAGEPLEQFLTRRLFTPLGMMDTSFNPDPVERGRIAPTERNSTFRPYLIHGEVHDENAFVLGGIAGHAGLFSTAQDLAVFAGLLTRGGILATCRHETGAGIPCGARNIPIEIRFFEEETVARFTGRIDPTISQGLGWDTPSGSSSSGDYFSANSYGHTGFTGTSIWIDPEREISVVLLTNRVNATRENTRHIAFRREVHNRIALAIRDMEIRPRPE